MPSPLPRLGRYLGALRALFPPPPRGSRVGLEGVRKGSGGGYLGALRAHFLLPCGGLEGV
eukprot:1194742-Prorocentrum_minimum.AAC.1